MTRLTLIAAIAAGLTLGHGVARSFGDDPNEVLAPDRVEEDWEAVILKPDAPAEGPQLTTSMTPDATTPDDFVAFAMNYRLKPVVCGGGMQVLAWSGRTLVADASNGETLLETAGETIAWTQSLKVSGGRLTYQIRSGTSETWGPFGDGDALRIDLETAAEDLANYDPAQSAARSGATWQADHVQRMTLLRVRFYRGTQLLETREPAAQVALTQ